MCCRSRYLLWGLIAVLGIGNMLVACGQKGPLYLPDSTTPQEQQKKQESDME